MVQVVVRALDILEFVGQHGKEPVQLMKIAENAGLSQPTTFNIVKTLVAKKYLEQVDRKTGYRLGPGVFQFTGTLSYSQNIVDAAKDIMEELGKELNETCLLGVLRNKKRIVLHAVASNHDLLVRTRAESDIYPTATGRLLIAFLSEKELNNLVKVIGLPAEQVWPGVQTREALEKELAKIRKDQFVQTLFSFKHIVGYAVPIRKNKEVVASLSVFLPESRYTPQLKDKIARLTNRAAKKIKEHLENET